MHKHLDFFFECKIVSDVISDTKLEPGEEKAGTKPTWINLSEIDNLEINDSLDIVSIIKKVFI